MYGQLEILGVMAEQAGHPYPQGLLQRGWDVILLNQFHDIIPGSAIGPVYEQTDREYEEILSEGRMFRHPLLKSPVPWKKCSGKPICQIRLPILYRWLRPLREGGIPLAGHPFLLRIRTRSCPP